jgi:hypothetical protein
VRQFCDIVTVKLTRWISLKYELQQGREQADTRCSSHSCTPVIISQSLDAFTKRFLSQQEVTEDVWGELIPQMMKGKAVVEQEKARHKFLACVFLAGVDSS